MGTIIERDLKDRTVGEVVAEDYARAAVFKRLGIDFCCGGDRSVQRACQQAGVGLEELEDALAAADPAVRRWPDPEGWDPAFLARYIVEVHHRYVRESLPVLRQFAQKVERVHGRTRPELGAIREKVSELAEELERHLEDEETEVFPLIAVLVDARQAGSRAMPADPEALLVALEDDHERAGTLMRELRELSDDFTPPETACNTYRALYAKLDEFEEDLHRHVHLENNVLFPRARALCRD